MNARTNAKVPPLDAVLVWVTNKVQRDYKARGLFPELRPALAKGRRDNARLYYLNAQQAEAMLTDAQQARATHGVRGMKFAYRCHAESLESAINAAARRVAEWGGALPANVWLEAHSERWNGTKAQLLAHGIQLEGPLPGEPGGKWRAVWGTDARGYRVRIERHRSLFPGRYEATIYPPSPTQQPDEREEPAGQVPDEAAAARALGRLRNMPNSADDFRGHVISCLRQSVGLSLGFIVSGVDWHGYRLTDVEGIHEAFDAIAEAVMAAPVSFDAERHAAIAQALRVQIASADGPVRAKVAELCKPNAALLAGSAQ